MPLARTFRHGIPTGHDGEEFPVDSNFASGRAPNIRTGRELSTGRGYRTGQGYSTGQSYDAGAVQGATPLTRAPAMAESTPAPSYAPAASAVTPDQLRERKARMQRIGTPNAGGTITQGGLTRSYAATPADDSSPMRPNMGGTISTEVAPNVTATQSYPATPTKAQPAKNNPLSGAGTAGDQVDGSVEDVEDVDPGQAMGITQRGGTTPAGIDATGSRSMGGTGLMARTFSSPKASSLYNDYVKRLGLA